MKAKWSSTSLKHGGLCRTHQLYNVIVTHTEEEEYNGGESNDWCYLGSKPIDCEWRLIKGAD